MKNLKRALQNVNANGTVKPTAENILRVGDSEPHRRGAEEIGCFFAGIVYANEKLKNSTASLSTELYQDCFELAKTLQTGFERQD